MSSNRPTRGPGPTNSSSRLPSSYQEALDMTPNSLPFTLDEALEKTNDCRKKVDTVICESLGEERVMRPLMDKRYKEDDTGLNDPSYYLPCLEEAQLGRIYSHGLMIARIHRQIADALYEDQKKGGDFETLWTMLPVDVRAHFIYRGFDNCSMATGGHAAHIRLKCPDLTTTTLSYGGGKGLFKIIRAIVHSAQTFKNTENYYPIISEEFDKYYEIDRAGTRNDLPQRRAIRMYQTINTHDRNFYIAIFVLTILRTLSVARPDLLFGTLVYKDRPVSRLPIAREREIVDEDPVSRRQAQERHDARPLPSKDAELDLFFSDPPKWNLCETCLSMLVIAVGESRASRALTPSHRIAYCSADCQRLDRPSHKIICGKLFSDIALVPAGWESPSTTPPPSVGVQFHHRLMKEASKGEAPYAIYVLRLSDDSQLLQSPLFPRKDPVLLTLSTLNLSEHSRVFDLLNQAITTKKEQHIKLYIIEIYSRVEREKGGAGEKAIGQLAREWGISEVVIKSWVEEEIAKVKMALMVAILSLGASGKRGKD